MVVMYYMLEKKIIKHICITCTVKSLQQTNTFNEIVINFTCLRLTKYIIPLEAQQQPTKKKDGDKRVNDTKNPPFF